MKRYAAPGIDSAAGEYGVYNSGAGLSPDRENFKHHGKITDWSSANPVCGLETGRLIGNYKSTKVPPANSLRIRRRGISPWSGYPNGIHPGMSRYNPESVDSMLNTGGSADMNPGVSSITAGGKGQASSMVRMNGHQRKNRGAKLPVLPTMAHRSDNSYAPTGGMTGMVPAPIVPEMFGLPSIVRIIPRRKDGGGN